MLGRTGRYITGFIGDCDCPETHVEVSRFLMKGTRTSQYYIQWASSIRSEDEDSCPCLIQALLISSDHLHFRLYFAISTPVTYRSVACAFGFSRFLKDSALSIMEVNQCQKFGEFDFTFLVFAAACRNEHKVQLLLDQGADINAQSGIYGNAWCTASATGDKKWMQLLLKKGA